MISRVNSTPKNAVTYESKCNFVEILPSHQRFADWDCPLISFDPLTIACLAASSAAAAAADQDIIIVFSSASATD